MVSTSLYRVVSDVWVQQARDWITVEGNPLPWAEVLGHVATLMELSRSKGDVVPLRVERADV